MPGTHVVERIEADPENVYFQEHLARYGFALEHIRGGPVLDIATGTGYGADLIRQELGALVVGADVDLPSLRRARAAYPAPRLALLAADATRLPFPDGAFAAVVSLETIEHIPDDRAFLRELCRVLAPGGACVISTPSRAHSELHGRRNPFHVREYLAEELLALLRGFFADVELRYQGFGRAYDDEVRQHAQAIQERTRALPAPLRLAVERVYRPVKRLVPARLRSLAIERLLRLRYPAPTAAALTIAAEPLPDTAVLLARCARPLPR